MFGAAIDIELGAVYRSYRADFNNGHSWMWALI